MLATLLDHLAESEDALTLARDGGDAFCASALRPFLVAALLAHSPPRPAIVVSFKTFTLDPQEAASGDPLQNAVQIADTTLQQGQGMHGS